jgi:hypothetical protein
MNELYGPRIDFNSVDGVLGHIRHECGYILQAVPNSRMDSRAARGRSSKAQYSQCRMLSLLAQVWRSCTRFVCVCEAFTAKHLQLDAGPAPEARHGATRLVCRRLS